MSLNNNKEEKKKYLDAVAMEETIQTDGWRQIELGLQELESDCRNDLVSVEPENTKEIIKLQTMIELLNKIRELPIESLEFLDRYRKKLTAK